MMCWLLISVEKGVDVNRSPWLSCRRGDMELFLKSLCHRCHSISATMELFFFNNQDNNNHFFKCARLATRPVNVACVTSLRGKNAAAVANKLEKDAGLPARPPELVITHS